MIVFDIDSIDSTEDASLLQLEEDIHTEYERMDVYERQELLEAFEAFTEDLDNAELTENGYKIHLRPESTDLLDGISQVTAAATTAVPSIVPRGTTPGKTPPKGLPRTVDDLSTSRAPSSNSYHWRTILSEGGSGRNTNRRLLDIVERGHSTSGLNARRLNRSGTRMLIGHPSRNRHLRNQNLFLNFRSNGYTVDVYDCRSTTALPTRWFSRFFRGSCSPPTTLRTNKVDDLGSLINKVGRHEIPDSFTGRVRTLRKGIFGGGLVYRWTKRLAFIGIPVAIIGTALWLSYDDDGEMSVIEVSEQSLEILKYVGAGIKDYLVNKLDNETVNNFIRDRNW